jgi:hypothetical protein
MIDKLIDTSYIVLIAIVLVLLFVLWFTRDKDNLT